jgi:Coenzyme PQQ synthesis protein D (PqqD)
MICTDPVPCEHVVFTEFDDAEGILVDLNTKKYYQLNETAMLIWKGLEQGLGTRQIADQIVATYEITPNDALRNVDQIVEKFQSYSLVSTSSDPAR